MSNVMINEFKTCQSIECGHTWFDRLYIDRFVSFYFESIAIFITLNNHLSLSQLLVLHPIPIYTRTYTKLSTL